MVQVPYSPVPDVTSQMEATPEKHISTPEAAFGGGIAQALQGLGQVTDKVGSELWQRATAMQELHNQADSDAAATKFGQDLSQINAKFTSAYGDQASPDALMKYNQDVVDLRNKYRGGLTNAVSQRFYDRDTLRQQAFAFSHAADHAARQLDSYQKASAGALGDTATDLAVTTGRPEALADAVQKRQSAAEIQFRGMGKDVIDQKKAEATSSVYSERLAALSAGNNIIGPNGSQEFFDKNKDKFIGKDLITAMNMIQKQKLSTGARQNADQVDRDMPGATPKDKVAEARARAAKLDPGNLEFQEASQNQVEINGARDERLQKQQEQTDNNTISDAIIKSQQAGHPISDIDGLSQSSPEAGKVIAKMAATDPTGVLKLQMRLKQMQKADNTPSDERTSNFQKLSGMAHSGDPTKFLDTDPSGMNLTAEHRAVVVGWQKQILKDGKQLDDPDLHVTLANPNVKMALHAAGIFDKNGEDYLKFSGALQDEINNIRTSGKSLSHKDTEEVATRLLQDHVTAHGRFWGDYKDKTFNVKGAGTFWTTQPLPSQVLEIRERATKQGRQLTDEEVQRVYSRVLFEQSLKKPVGD